MSGLTVVEICNLALSNIRSKSINSLNDETQQAQYCKLKYPVVRDKLLRDFNWRFAKKTQALALRTDTPHRWRLAYHYPSDCSKIISVTTNEILTANNRERLSLRYTPDSRIEAMDYRVAYEVLSSAGDVIIGSDADNIVVEYTYRVEDPSIFDPNFVLVMSWYLASQLAIPILGEGKGRQLMSDCLAMYQTLLSEALAADFDEAYSPDRPESDLITGRY